MTPPGLCLLFNNAYSSLSVSADRLHAHTHSSLEHEPFSHFIIVTYSLLARFLKRRLAAVICGDLHVQRFLTRFESTRLVVKTKGG